MNTNEYVPFVRVNIQDNDCLLDSGQTSVENLFIKHLAERTFLYISSEYPTY